MSWSPSIWLYPGGSGTLEEIVLSAQVGLSDLQEEPRPIGGFNDSIGGALATMALGENDEVILSVANFVDEDLRRRLVSVERHLRMGGVITFAGIRLKAYAGWLSAAPGQGISLFTVDSTRNLFGALSGGSATLADGDEVTFRGPPPASYTDQLRISNWTGGATHSFSTTQKTMFDYHSVGGPVLVRHRDFWPLLKLVGDRRRPLLTSNLRRTYSFQARLRINFSALLSAHGSNGEGGFDLADSLSGGVAQTFEDVGTDRGYNFGRSGFQRYNWGG